MSERFKAIFNSKAVRKIGVVAGRATLAVGAVVGLAKGAEVLSRMADQKLLSAVTQPISALVQPLGINTVIWSRDAGSQECDRLQIIAAHSVEGEKDSASIAIRVLGDGVQNVATTSDSIDLSGRAVVIENLHDCLPQGVPSKVLFSVDNNGAKSEQQIVVSP